MDGGGGWKDGRMVEVDGRLMRRWVDGSLSLDEAKVGVSVAEAAETLVGLFRWWVEGGPAKPSQVKKSDASSYVGSGQKNDLCEGCK